MGGDGVGNVGGKAAARWLAVMSGAAASAGEACAGAWSQPKGSGQMIASVSHERGDFGEVWRADDLIEYGFATGWEASLKLETSLTYADDSNYRTGAQLGLKRSFPLGDRAAVALQGAVLTGESILDLGCTGGGYEARAAIGTSFNLAGREAFVNVEGGWREQGDDCRRTLAEAAVGIDITDHWRGIAKAWMQQDGSVETAKAEIAVLRRFGDFSLGLGYREEISGAFEERGGFATVWWRF